VQTNTDPYDDDDDHPTLQRPAPTSKAMPVAAAAAAAAVAEEATATEIEVVDYAEMETPKIPIDVAAVLLRASKTDDERPD
jgi:hypothetical protein